MAALASGLDVGLMALTRRTPTGGDRLLALHVGPLPLVEQSQPVA